MKFEQVREKVLSTCLALADRGYLAGTGGNVALRADAEHFALTPSGKDYYAMDPSDICLMRFGDLAQVDGESPASVEAGLHANVLKARPDCAASIHTHQPVASAYTLLARPLAVENPEHHRVLGKTIPCAGYAPSGTGLLAWRVGRAFRHGAHACLMRNHGVVCVGSDAEEAMTRVALLESVCSAWFHAAVLDETTKTAGSVRALVAEFLASAERPERHEVRK